MVIWFARQSILQIQSREYYMFQFQFSKSFYVTHVPLLPISGFVLDKKFQRNASKFVISYTYENTKLIFPFFISCYFIIPLMNALVYVNIRGKNKLARNENWKKQHWVFVNIKYGKFLNVSLELFVKHKP